MEDQGNIPVVRNNSGQVSVWAVVIILLIAAVIGVWFWRGTEVDDLSEEISEKNQTISQLQSQTDEETTVTYMSEDGTQVQVFMPQANDTISSPLIVLGQVPGNWSFEASFPVELRDSEGNVIAEGQAELQGDWMTEELVPFVAVFEFDSPDERSGNVTLIKANPSGLPENDDQVSISVNF